MKFINNVNYFVEIRFIVLQKLCCSFVAVIKSVLLFFCSVLSDKDV